MFNVWTLNQVSHNQIWNSHTVLIQLHCLVLVRSYVLFLSVSQVNQLDAHSAQNVETVGTLYVMKSRPLQDVLVDSIYKSGARVEAQKTEDMFPEVRGTLYRFDSSWAVKAPK